MDLLNKILGKKKEADSPVFAVGTGRCGTHLLESLMGAVKGIDAHHIQDLLGDSFFRYCAWNEMDVDLEGFFAPRRRWIAEAQRKGKGYFESNPYLSFHMKELAEEFDARFIFIYRHPEPVVKSHVVKGWYANSLDFTQHHKPMGFQYDMQPNHFFGRMVPKGDEYQTWSRLTQVGKIAWMYNQVNSRVLAQVHELEDRVFVLPVEKLDYAKYEDMCKFLGKDKVPKETTFDKIATSRPGKSKKPTDAEWSEKERREFKVQVSPVMESLGYKL